MLSFNACLKFEFVLSTNPFTLLFLLSDKNARGAYDDVMNHSDVI